jgi:hypothetical protein
MLFNADPRGSARWPLIFPSATRTKERGSKMTPSALLRKVRRLPEQTPITTSLERVLRKRGMLCRDPWYKSQKQHWIGWLEEYCGPGAYGRKTWDHSAEFAYNHIVCPPMVLWLAEASGVARGKIVEAKTAALSIGPSLGRQSAAIRRVAPWTSVEACLNDCNIRPGRKVRT